MVKSSWTKNLELRLKKRKLIEPILIVNQNPCGEIPLPENSFEHFHLSPIKFTMG